MEDFDWISHKEALYSAAYACPNTTAAFELCSLMSEISEDHYAAGWLGNLEYDLFAAAFEGCQWGYGLTATEIGKLIELCHRCDGWWIYGRDGNEFLRLADWLEVYKQGPQEH
jgi:hypothetical protein